MKPGKKPISAEIRFWEKVDKNGPIPLHRPELGPCWQWTAAKDRKGYGRIGVPPAFTFLTHRFAWALANGDAGDLCVLHKCDNASCVRLSHLFLGTVPDNNADMYAKGRGATSELRSKRIAETVPRGTEHTFAKLTPALVRKIRRMSASGIMQKTIAESVGVSRQSVWDVRNNKTWRHVP